MYITDAPKVSWINIHTICYIFNALLYNRYTTVPRKSKKAIRLGRHQYATKRALENH